MKTMKTLKTLHLAALIFMSALSAGRCEEFEDVVVRDGSSRFFRSFGMRLGASYLIPNNGPHGEILKASLLRDNFDHRTMVVSDFGFQLEPRIPAFDNHPQVVMSLLCMVSGFNYGEAVPEASFIIGWRIPDWLEFGGGPAVTTSGRSESNAGLEPGFVFTLGRTGRFGRLAIPLTAKLTQVKSGHCVSLLTGFDW